jgi:hypothetical protein
MRIGVDVRLNPGDRERIEAVVDDRISLQKHARRAEIVLPAGSWLTWGLE